jgi:type I restriction enzyme, S subunit
MALTKSVSEIIEGDSSGLLAIHPSWKRVSLAEVGCVLNGFPFDSAQFSNSEGTPLVRIRDVVSGETNTFYSGAFDLAYVVKAGDLVLGMDGDFNAGRWRSADALLNQRVCKIEIDARFYVPGLIDRVLPAYLEAINAETSSVTVKHLSSRTIEDLRLPLPPLAEQHRLAEKLDELFSELDAGVAELQAAQKKLAQYRQSLLKAAVEGALTADWRAANPPQETGEALLARILQERRARWESRQLDKFKAMGKTPPKGWQNKYPEPMPPETIGLPLLPKGWVWSSVDQLSDSVRNGLSKTPNTQGLGFPIFKINAVRPMAVNFSAIKHIEIDEDEAKDYWVEAGDVLATRYNGSVDLLGVFGMVKEVRGRTLHPDKLIRMKPVLGMKLGAWMEVCGNVGVSRAHLVSRVKTTAGQTGISGEDLKKTPIPLAPAAEGDGVIATLEERLAAIRDLEHPIEMALKQAAAQRQNILRVAFAGQLVPQDPADEPASALLARIRAERAKQATRKKAIRARMPRRMNKETP